MRDGGQVSEFPALSGFDSVEQIGGGSWFHWYRARRLASHQPVLIKLVQRQSAVDTWSTRLRQERAASGHAGIEGVLPVLDYVETSAHSALIFEDLGGQPLDQILQTRRLALPAALRIVQDLATTLAALHQRRVIRGDVQPCHVLVDLATGDTQLTGLGGASQVSYEVLLGQDLSLVTSSLAYMSPERTGRANRVVDYRADFYALGVMLFQMLTGRLPFDASDALALVHAHLAQRPPSPSSIDSAIAEPVSRIVLKLLAKMPEDRYQSARGLHADVTHCLHTLETTVDIQSFTVGERDIPTRLEPPEHLYGRSISWRSMTDSRAERLIPPLLKRCLQASMDRRSSRVTSELPPSVPFNIVWPRSFLGKRCPTSNGRSPLIRARSLLLANIRSRLCCGTCGSSH
jgi:serine/threonine protein kinase